MQHFPKLKLGIEAVQLACQVISEIPLSVKVKSDASPVTLADFSSQAIITTLLNDNVIAEESLPSEEMRLEINKLSPIPIHWEAFERHNTNSDKGWFLDPIDGTKGYVRNDQYAVCLAYFDQHVQFSIIGCPNLGYPTMANATKGTLMVSIKDKGTYQSPLYAEWHIESALKCACKVLPSMVQSFESSHVDQTVVDDFIIKYKIKDIIRMDSQAKYVVVARGEVGFYVRATPSNYIEKIWDHAAGYLAINEANGVCKQLSLKEVEMTFQKELLVDGILGCHASILNHK